MTVEPHIFHSFTETPNLSLVIHLTGRIKIEIPFTLPFFEQVQSQKKGGVYKRAGRTPAPLLILPPSFVFFQKDERLHFFRRLSEAWSPILSESF